MDLFPWHPNVAACPDLATSPGCDFHRACSGDPDRGRRGGNERTAERHRPRPERLSDQQEREDRPDRRPRAARAATDRLVRRALRPDQRGRPTVSR